MAFGFKQIAPIDTRPGVAVGVSVLFNNAGVFTPTYTTKDAIKSNLINYLLTNKGDRYNNPSFGGNLRKYVFEQIQDTTIDTIKDDITTAIQNYFPNIDLQNIIILRQPDTNQIFIEIYYTITTTGEQDNILITFA